MVSNIWVAASDNDIPLVKKYISEGKYTAISKDPNGYTPIHAAVSYGHIELLEYLIKEKNGDINIQDNEGDTPLHQVEDVKLAKLLVEEYGADWKLQNHEGQTAADFIEEDDEFPEVVQYLRSLYHDKPQDDGQTTSNILDSLPRPDQVKDHQIRYTYENDDSSNDIRIDIDDAKRLQLKEIVESENPEERLKDFLKDAVHQQINNEQEVTQQIDSPASKKRKD